jgi:hypothetical protein
VLFRDGINQPGYETASEFMGTKPPAASPPHVHGG